jgi:hypothetical protein
MFSPKRVILCIAFLSSMIAAAAPWDNDELFFWKWGLYVGINAQLEACNIRYPETKEQNESAYTGSAFWYPITPALIERRIEKESSDGEKEFLLKEILAAQPEVRAKFLSFPSEIIHALCTTFPEKLAQSEQRLFGTDIKSVLQRRRSLSNETNKYPQ